MSKEELVEELSSEITKDVLVQRIAEALATEKVEELEKNLSKFPNTIILKEEYKHPQTPQCVGCPHPQGRYTHPEEPQCNMPKYSHPKDKLCEHDHSGETLRPQRLNPLYCTLRTITKVREASDVDDSAIADDKILVYESASKKHKYESKPTGVTDHGALTGLGDDDHTQYVPTDGVARQLADAGYPNALLLDGSKQMTGALDLDVGGHLVTFLKSKNFAFKEQGLPVSKILLMNRAETDYMSLYLKTLFATQGVQASSFAPLGNSHNYIQSYGDTAKHVYIQSYNGSMVTCIDFYNGKVLMPNLPTSDPGVADQIYSDGGTLKISSGP